MRKSLASFADFWQLQGCQLNSSAIAISSECRFGTGFRKFLLFERGDVGGSESMPSADSESAERKHPKERPWLTRYPRWIFHFNSTSCSWANAVEGFFATLTRRRLQRGVFRSLVDLQAAINRYLGEHNRKPKPFVWTARSRSYHRKGQPWAPSNRVRPVGNRVTMSNIEITRFIGWNLARGMLLWRLPCREDGLRVVAPDFRIALRAG